MVGLDTITEKTALIPTQTARNREKHNKSGQLQVTGSGGGGGGGLKEFHGSKLNDAVAHVSLTLTCLIDRLYKGTNTYHFHTSAGI